LFRTKSSNNQYDNSVKDLLQDQSLTLELRRLIDCFQRWCSGSIPASGHLIFMVKEVLLGWVFSKYFGFPRHFSFLQLSDTHYSSHYRCCIVSILIVSLNSQQQKNSSASRPAYPRGIGKISSGIKLRESKTDHSPKFSFVILKNLQFSLQD
jgi:hypothetical protein